MVNKERPHIGMQERLVRWIRSGMIVNIVGELADTWRLANEAATETGRTVAVIEVDWDRYGNYRSFFQESIRANRKKDTIIILECKDIPPEVQRQIDFMHMVRGEREAASYNKPRIEDFTFLVLSQEPIRYGYEEVGRVMPVDIRGGKK